MFSMKSQQIGISFSIESSKEALLSFQLSAFVCVVFNVMALKQLLINTRIQLAIFCKWLIVTNKDNVYMNTTFKKSVGKISVGRRSVLDRILTLETKYLLIFGKLAVSIP